MGDGERIAHVRDCLWNLGFTAQVYKKAKTRASKGVDIALTTEMLGHAFRNNYDKAVLVAGDADFVSLVEEVKRLGKQVVVWFFSTRHGLSPALKNASDEYFDLSNRFDTMWHTYASNLQLSGTQPNS